MSTDADPRNRLGNFADPRSDSAEPPSGHLGPAEAEILAGLPDPCPVLDREWRVTYANLRAEQLFGRPPAEGAPPLIGRPIWEGRPELANGEFARDCRDALVGQRPVTTETCFPLQDGWF